MKHSLLSFLASLAILAFLVACGDKTAVVVENQPPVVKPKPKLYQPVDPEVEAAEQDAALEREIAALEAESEKLRQEIELNNSGSTARSLRRSGTGCSRNGAPGWKPKWPPLQ